MAGGCFLTLSLLLLITLSLTFPATGKLSEPEKLSHFRFYWHDVQSGTNPTSITIAKPNNNLSTSPTGFGFMNMIDDPMTENPGIGSKMVGRAQGFYGLCSKEEMSLLMSMSFGFVTGRYNGSTLIVLGRNPVNEKVREMPVVGGSGVFRFARGYVQARTYSFNLKTGDAIVRYDAYVLH